MGNLKTQEKELEFSHVKLSRKSRLTRLKNSWQLYVLLALPIIFVFIFSYIPMYGVQIAFKKYYINKGILGSPWVGFDNFTRFFRSYDFVRLIKNTLVLSLYGLIAGFPIPIILALALNCCKSKKFMKSVQMITYMPHFISTVIIVGLLMQMLSPKWGIVNIIIKLFGGTPVDFMGKAPYFKHVYVWSGIWQSMGFSSIIYLSALSGVDTSLHEAALIDGATRFQRVIHIDIPSILPTVVTLLILNTGGILSTGFEKILLMQNPLNMSASETIDTYVYKVGLASDTANYSYPTAIGLFTSFVGMILLCIVNFISKKVSDSSLW